MNDYYRWPSWVKKESVRQTALSFFTRYWGMGEMQRQRTLASVPLLPFEKDDEGEGCDA